MTARSRIFHFQGNSALFSRRRGAALPQMRPALALLWGNEIVDRRGIALPAPSVSAHAPGRLNRPSSERRGACGLFRITMHCLRSTFWILLHASRPGLETKSYFKERSRREHSQKFRSAVMLLICGNRLVFTTTDWREQSETLIRRCFSEVYWIGTRNAVLRGNRSSFLGLI